ncbi:MAG TPA: MFS transporter, partial [Anaerolineae bacterium]
FVVNGVSRTAANIAFPSYLLEIAPAGERPLYVGFTNTVLGVATFIPVIGGILLDAAGFGVVLWLTLAISALGVWLARGMVEPRKVMPKSQAFNV